MRGTLPTESVAQPSCRLATSPIGPTHDAQSDSQPRFQFHPDHGAPVEMKAGKTILDGPRNFSVIERGGNYGIRLKDNKAGEIFTKHSAVSQ